MTWRLDPAEVQQEVSRSLIGLAMRIGLGEIEVESVDRTFDYLDPASFPLDMETPQAIGFTLTIKAKMKP